MRIDATSMKIFSVYNDVDYTCFTWKNPNSAEFNYTVNQYSNFRKKDDS